VILMVIVLCGLGYWGLFYSSFPLRMLESSIEESGAVEIEDMKGNLSTGVEIRKLRFRENPDDTEWSELNGIEVKYRTVGSAWNKTGFVVEKINIDSARFLVHLDEDFDVNTNLDFSGFFREIASFGDGNFDFDVKNGEVEIKQVWLKDIVLADPDSGRELRIDEIRFDGMRVVDGELKHMGDVTVRADLLEIVSSASERYADRPINRRFDVRLKKEATLILIQDLPLQIDFGYLNAKQTAASVSAFGGQILYDPPDGGEQFHLRFAGYTPADFLDGSKFGVMPSDVRLDLVSSKATGTEWKLVEGEGEGEEKVEHSFGLGKTIFVVSEAGAGKMEYVATGIVQGQPVTATLVVSGQLPLLKVRLKSAEAWSDQDLWARTVFDKPFMELDEERQQTIERTVDAAKEPPPVDAKKPEDMGAPDESGDGPETGTTGDGG